MVRPKKFLGQHFLKDQNIAAKIVEALQAPGLAEEIVVEIGPGTGVLTQFLVKRLPRLHLVEIDRESVAYLHQHYPDLKTVIHEADFLTLNLEKTFPGPIHIIGNFPYNISSQIFFKVLDYRPQVKQVVCMLQKEVADRIVSPPGNKTYGILSVLLQAYYDMEYLFKVPPGVFFPPPKVTSAVIRLVRNSTVHLGCDEVLFKQVVKQAFQTRRKTLRNALKSLNLPASLTKGHASSLGDLLDKRAEQLSVEQFVLLTKTIEESREGVR
jgi:16S rRNA (adenine1518-N6/adenine1519-N6)-dimethyltransferase